MADSGSSTDAFKGGLEAADFTPLDQEKRHRKLPFSPVVLVLGILGIFATVVMVYLFAARAVIFIPDPVEAEIKVSGLSFNIGNNYLLLRGDHKLTATAPGYRPLENTVSVSNQRSQEFKLQLDPLPGRLQLTSELEEIEVLLAGEVVGSGPGVIEDLPKGKHIFEFRKHRYFPLQAEIEIQGKGLTQDHHIELIPAWGEMQFSSEPAGAEVFVDDVAVGLTPLSTEVLETGNRLRLVAPGYKVFEKDISVQAGSSVAHPPIAMIVADGRLAISSSPAGAGVTIDDRFLGNTPVTVPLSPLGSHRVELFLKGYQRASRNVRIEPEEDSGISVRLTPILGDVQVTVSPPQAEVFVDGQSRGTGSQRLSLTAKDHRIEVRLQGHATQGFDVLPRPDLAQSLDVELLTDLEAYWASRPPRIQSPVGSHLKLFKPSATFSLGAPRREPGRRANEAQRKVRLERPFYMGIYEVSNEEFRRWKEEHTSRAVQGQTLDMDDQPAVYLSWQEAALFCNWLSRIEGLPLFYLEENGQVTGFNVDAHGYRMPTEAEWAWAAKINEAGDTMMFPWEGDLYPPPVVLANYADQSAVKILPFTLGGYSDGFPTTAPVGSFAANEKGLFNLSGNVSEWVTDYFEIRSSQGDPELDPTGPATGNRHAVRGASWAKGARTELRLSYRDAGLDGNMDIGFRLARYVDKSGASP